MARPSLAAKGAARAEIARLFGDSTLERCPGYRDPGALLAGIVRISQSDDLALALKAGLWLVEYAASLRNGKCPAKEEAASAVSPNGSQQWRVC